MKASPSSLSVEPIAPGVVGKSGDQAPPVTYARPSLFTAIASLPNHTDYPPQEGRVDEAEACEGEFGHEGIPRCGII